MTIIGVKIDKNNLRATLIFCLSRIYSDTEGLP